MIIVQLTDTHVMPRGEKLAGLIDTNGMLAEAVRHVNSLEPRPALALVTGDLVDRPSVESYAMLRELLDRLEIESFLIPGNHDARPLLVAAFAHHAYLPRDGFLQYTVEEHPVRLVALDTTLPDRDEGRLCDERLAWLDQTLAAAPDRPTLILMHHPPFETGIWWMDAQGLGGAAAMRAVVERHPQVALVVCGHLHRPIQTGWGGTVVSVAPSTAHQVHLDLVPESRPHMVFEPPACHLHVWNGEGFVTHTSYVGWHEKPVDISPYMGDWEQVRAELRRLKGTLR